LIKKHVQAKEVNGTINDRGEKENVDERVNAEKKDGKEYT
jgi:hypothetical protein